MSEELRPSFDTLGAYAGFVTRLLAYLVDRVIVAIISFLTVMAVHWVLNAFRINQLLFGWNEIPWQVASAFGAVVYIVVAFGYDIAFWILVGQTPGKRLMGVRIVRTNGERVRLGNALLRHLAYILSGLLFLGYLWILFDNRRQGWHDKLGGTIVVYTWPEEELQGTMVRDRVQQFLQERQQAQSDA